jgi:hypothetical protein
MLFATLAVIALTEAHRTDHLQTALGNRDVIGQAKGILMERYRLTADAAFAHLTRTSQDVSMKLSAVALHLVETGELLGGSRPGSVTHASRGRARQPEPALTAPDLGGVDRGAGASAALLAVPPVRRACARYCPGAGAARRCAQG